MASGLDASCAGQAYLSSRKGKNHKMSCEFDTRYLKELKSNIFTRFIRLVYSVLAEYIFKE